MMKRILGVLACAAMAMLCASTSAMAFSSSTNLITNGSFETGDFTGWTPSGTPNCAWQVVQGSTSGCYSAWFGDTYTAEDGSDFAHVSWDGGAEATPKLTQTVSIPASTTDTLAWHDWTSWNLCCAMKPRLEVVQILSGSNVLKNYTINTLAPNSSGDTGWISHSLNLSAYAGKTVGIRFLLTVPEDYSGPADFSLDNVSLTSS
jgi:hypothetical protein